MGDVDLPLYISNAMPYEQQNAEQEGHKWELQTALAIVNEAVVAFDGPVLEGRAIPEQSALLPVGVLWPNGLESQGTGSDVMQAMISAYFDKKEPSQSLPDMGLQVPALENDFDMWLRLRKAQWRKARQKCVEQHLMPEEDFSFWLWSRKWDWLRQRLRKHTLNAPQIEKDAMQWIRAKKIIWRLQRKCHKMERESLNMVNTRR